MTSLVRAFVVILATFLAANAWAVDLNEYNTLVDRANAAHDLLEGAPDERADVLRATAAEADMAVLDWLDAFLVTPDFDTLAEDQQAVVYRNRYRWEYNLVGLLIELERCAEARDRIRSLLDRAMPDDELRPRLTETYDRAVECAERVAAATLTVEANPPDAEVFLDGVLLGLATGTFSLPLGPHIVSLRASGYVSHEEQIVAANDGQELHLGPIELALVPPPDRAPHWYHWTLWTAAAAGIGTGVYYFVWARDREDTIENPPTGLRPRDPDAERAIIDDLDLVAILAGSAGLVCLITGTISFLSESGDPPATADSDDVSWSIGPTGVVWSLRF